MKSCNEFASYDFNYNAGFSPRTQLSDTSTSPESLNIQNMFEPTDLISDFVWTTLVREEGLQLEMELEESLFTAASLRTRISVWSTLDQEFSPWPMLEPTPTAPSSSFALPRPSGWMESTWCLARSDWSTSSLLSHAIKTQLKTTRAPEHFLPFAVDKFFTLGWLDELLLRELRKEPSESWTWNGPIWSRWWKGWMSSRRTRTLAPSPVRLPRRSFTSSPKFRAIYLCQQ